MELRTDSINYLQSTPKEYLKKMGQFFTSETIRLKLIKMLPKIKSPTILEPSFGSGEFIDTILNFYPDAKITGIEKDKKLFNLVSKRYIDHDVRCEDFLDFNEKNKYDFVIGNPPYFEIAKTKIPSKFNEILNGRPNIYSLFIKLGIDALKPGGYLAFVIPPSMNNGAYFSALREYIIKNTEIEHINVFNDSDLFLQATQRIMILVLKKMKNTGKNIFNIGDHSCFTSDVSQLKNIYKDSINLFDCGYRVKTGSVVWNQNKELLSNNKNKRLLVWAKNIESGKINKNNLKHPKGQYVDLKEYESYPAIVINRVIGNSSSPNIRASIINEPFLAENHVNVIYPVNPKKSIKEIYDILLSDKIKKVISILIGNTQLSKTEIEKILPF